MVQVYRSVQAFSAQHTYFSIRNEFPSSRTKFSDRHLANLLVTEYFVKHWIWIHPSRSFHSILVILYTRHGSTENKKRSNFKKIWSSWIEEFCNIWARNIPDFSTSELTVWISIGKYSSLTKQTLYKFNFSFFVQKCDREIYKISVTVLAS